LFSTPVGIVTPASVRKARSLLVQIGDFVAHHDLDNDNYVHALEQYLVLVPQDVGMKRGWHRTFLTSVRDVQQQGDILDSLDASYRAVMSGQGKKQKTKDEPMEKVFDVEVHELDDRATRRRIEKLYADSANRRHTSYGLHIRRIYIVRILSVSKVFEVTGKKVGNIKELWHGTKASNLLSILKNGLIIPPSSSAHVTGRMYGNGLYFSDQSTKALNYATTFWGGRDEKRYFMFVAAVAMGKPFIPQSTRWGSAGSYSYPQRGYDSTFAQANVSGVKNNEMIVYRTDQVDLRFLIEFG
jgi:poly [ADP-ribose] polymerase